MSDLRELIDSIKDSNEQSIASLKEVERDGRNSRRHLLEIKKSVLRMEEMVQIISAPPENVENSLDEEERREKKARDERLIAAVEKLSGGGDRPGSGARRPRAAGGSVISGAQGLLSGLLGGITGGALGSVLGGAGLFLAGVAAAGTAAIFALEKFESLDTNAIKANIMNLLSISEEFEGGNLEMLKDGGAFGLAMTGIGLGLAAFSVGAGVAAAVEHFAGDIDWTTNIKKNVKELLSIKDELGGNVNMLLDGGTFGLAMTGIGIGLAALSIGQGASAAVDYFTQDGWSQRIKDNVVTLLSIKDELGGNVDMLSSSGSFVLAMTGLGLGLAAFSVGQGASVGASAMAETLEHFSGTGWAEQIKQNVQTLLSISDLPGLGMDTAVFIATMGGIAAGLTAFALGKGANVIVDGADQAIATFTDDEQFAERIKTQVGTLLSITEMANEGKATSFVATMGQMAAGILAFTASDAIGTLADAGQKVLGFFGVESPFSKIMDVAENSDKLEQGAAALTSIGDSLRRFSEISFDGADFNFRDFADDLKEAVPLIEKAVMGDSGGLFGTRIEGLANNIQRYEDAARNIETLRDALGETSAPVQPTIINNYYGGGASGGGGNSGPVTAIVADEPSPFSRDPNLDNIAVSP